MTIPVRLSAPDKWADCETVEDRAAEAHARFRAEWPVERTRDMAAFLQGDEDAGLRIAARALEKRQPVSDADRAVMGLLTDTELYAHSKDHGRFVRRVRGGL